MPWCKINISVHQPNFEFDKKIRDEFEMILLDSQHRKDMALFSSGWSATDTFNMYFSPACSSNPAMKALMDRYEAIPCDEPTRDTEKSMTLVFGDEIRWNGYAWSPDD